MGDDASDGGADSVGGGVFAGDTASDGFCVGGVAAPGCGGVGGGSVIAGAVCAGTVGVAAGSMFRTLTRNDSTSESSSSTEKLGLPRGSDSNTLAPSPCSIL